MQALEIELNSANKSNSHIFEDNASINHIKHEVQWMCLCSRRQTMLGEFLATQNGNLSAGVINPNSENSGPPGSGLNR